MIPSMALLPFLSGQVHKSPKPQAPVEFQPTSVTAQVVITLASLDHQQKVSLMMVINKKEDVKNGDDGGHHANHKTNIFLLVETEASSSKEKLRQ